MIGRRGRDPVITRMERRLADWTHLGVEFQEDTQILRCAAGNVRAATNISHHDKLQVCRQHAVLLGLLSSRDKCCADGRQLGKSFQLCCRYGVGQKYGAHFDSLVEQSPRIATALIYLQVRRLQSDCRTSLLQCTLGLSSLGST
jgi:hypothetical protein